MSKYIKLSVKPDTNLVFYEVLETKNIDFVEPGYEYQVTRPQTFKNVIDPEQFADVEIHLVLDTTATGTETRPLYVTSPKHDPIETVNA